MEHDTSLKIQKVNRPWSELFIHRNDANFDVKFRDTATNRRPLSHWSIVGFVSGLGFEWARFKVEQFDRRPRNLGNHAARVRFSLSDLQTILNVCVEHNACRSASRTQYGVKVPYSRWSILSQPYILSARHRDTCDSSSNNTRPAEQSKRC